MQTDLAAVHSLVSALADRIAAIERHLGIQTEAAVPTHGFVPQDIGSDLASIEDSLETVMASLDEPDPMPSIVDLNESRESRVNTRRERPAGWQPVASRRAN